MVLVYEQGIRQHTWLAASSDSSQRSVAISYAATTAE